MKPKIKIRYHLLLRKDYSHYGTNIKKVKFIFKQSLKIKEFFILSY